MPAVVNRRFIAMDTIGFPAPDILFDANGAVLSTFIGFFFDATDVFSIMPDFRFCYFQLKFL